MLILLHIQAAKTEHLYMLNAINDPAVRLAMQPENNYHVQFNQILVNNHPFLQVDVSINIYIC